MVLHIGFQRMVSSNTFGNLETLTCLVEDFVYNNLNTTASELINAGLNNLFGEITWFYCTKILQ